MYTVIRKGKGQRKWDSHVTEERERREEREKKGGWREGKKRSNTATDAGDHKYLTEGKKKKFTRHNNYIKIDRKLK